MECDTREASLAHGVGGEVQRPLVAEPDSETTKRGYVTEGSIGREEKAGCRDAYGNVNGQVGGNPGSPKELNESTTSEYMDRHVKTRGL
jgi:hypothetical protein